MNIVIKPFKKSHCPSSPLSVWPILLLELVCPDSDTVAWLVLELKSVIYELAPNTDDLNSQCNVSPTSKATAKEPLNSWLVVRFTCICWMS